MHRSIAVLVFAALVLVLAPPAAHAAERHGCDRATANAALVRDAFEAWRQGRGSVFDLLAEDVEWTVAGGSPVSGTYRSRRAFLEQAVQPITSRLATPIVPQVESIVAQGDEVVVSWYGSADTRAGGRYRNHYAWRLTFADGRIVRATAFLDTWALAQLMR